jgi:multidrug efflux pump subunit AcrA (membrane-fusion protein)
MPISKRLLTIKNWFLARPLAHKVLIVVGLLFLTWLIYSKILAPQTPTTDYETASVEKGTIVSTISASGIVVSSNIYSITTQASGVVKKIYVDQGAEVTKGQKIADIELDLEGAQGAASAYASYVSAVNSLKAAENSLRSTQASLDVVYDQIKGHDTDETLVMKETRTRAEVAKDNAYNGLASARANLVTTANTLQNNSATIVAPTSGTLTSLTIAEGVSLSASTSSSGTRTGQRVASIVKN